MPKHFVKNQLKRCNSFPEIGIGIEMVSDVISTVNITLYSAALKTENWSESNSSKSLQIKNRLAYEMSFDILIWRW